jgi:putative endonuclease
VVYYVYILASRPNGTLYVGVTNDLVRRIYEHREGLADGFTKRYGVKRLVHYEPFDDIRLALQREKNIKHWSRAWKVALIEEHNPLWSDLWAGIARP